METLLFAAALAAVVFGVVLLLLGAYVALRRKTVRAMAYGLSGGVILAGGVTAALFLTNVYTYHRLVQEQTVGVLQFEQLGKQHYRAVLQEPDAPSRNFELFGDEWQLDARVLKWQGLAVLMGFDPLYRLERLSGRYQDLAQERRDRRSVHGLASAAPMDLWRLAQQYPQWLPWVDALYGNAAYMPMSDGARYLVTLSNSGLVVRPRNAVAGHAIEDWR